jgi:hypothetical protein
VTNITRLHSLLHQKQHSSNHINLKQQPKSNVDKLNESAGPSVSILPAPSTTFTHASSSKKTILLPSDIPSSSGLLSDSTSPQQKKSPSLTDSSELDDIDGVDFTLKLLDLRPYIYESAVSTVLSAPSSSSSASIASALKQSSQQNAAFMDVGKMYRFLRALVHIYRSTSSSTFGKHNKHASSSASSHQQHSNAQDEDVNALAKRVRHVVICYYPTSINSDSYFSSGSNFEDEDDQSLDFEIFSPTSLSTSFSSFSSSPKPAFYPSHSPSSSSSSSSSIPLAELGLQAPHPAYNASLLISVYLWWQLRKTCDDAIRVVNAFCMFSQMHFKLIFLEIFATK